MKCDFLDLLNPYSMKNMMNKTGSPSSSQSQILIVFLVIHLQTYCVQSIRSTIEQAVHFVFGYALVNGLMYFNSIFRTLVRGMSCIFRLELELILV